MLVRLFYRFTVILHLLNRRLSTQLLQLFGLLAGGKGVDHLVQITVHDLFQIVDGQADAVVGAAILREVVVRIFSLRSPVPTCP